MTDTVPEEKPQSPGIPRCDDGNCHCNAVGGMKTYNRSQNAIKM